MIGQEHDARHFERTQCLDFDYSLTQERTGMFVVEYVPMVECDDGEEIRPACTKPSSIFRHDSVLFRIGAMHRTLPRRLLKGCNPPITLASPPETGIAEALPEPAVLHFSEISPLDVAVDE